MSLHSHDLVGVRESSIEAYHTDKMCSGEVKRRILDYALRTSSFTARMVEEELGIRGATIAGLINPLVRDGVLIREPDRKPCAITGNSANWLNHKDFKQQGSLFS